MTAEVLTEAEVEAQRQITPGTRNVNHLNHAGSSLPPQVVIDAQIDFLRLESEIGGAAAAASVAETETEVYTSIAGFIGAKPTEIARAEHATFAWNSAFWSLPLQAGQKILTAEAAYAANAVAYLRAQQRFGVTVEVLPSDDTGQLDLDALEASIGDDVAVIAITHVPTNGGLINPAAEVGALANAAGIPYLLDACQSTGQLKIDVDNIGCDMLSVTGRKFLRGPRGTGFLYVRESMFPILETDHPDLHSAHWVAPDRYELLPDARRFEYWEYNHAAWIGLGAAVDHAASIGIERIETTVQQQAKRLRDSLDDARFPVFDLGVQRSGIVTTTCDGVDPYDVQQQLREQKINVSVSSPDSTLWDATRRALPPLLRLSLHYTTTNDEISLAVAALINCREPSTRTS
jgi:selenocysteine lyase/cysteine desulfurase